MISDKFKNINKIVSNGNVTTPYGGQTKDEKFHPGLDIAQKNGTPIKSNIKGKVIGLSNSQRDFGKSLIIKDSKGNIHRYSHLKDVFVGKGTPIQKDTHIANMGDSGNSYSPTGGDSSHLDYRVYGKGGKSINPTKFLK